MKTGRNLCLTACYLFFYAPIVIIIVYSFNNADHAITWQSFTTKWYTTLFQDKSIWVVTWHSFTIGILAATLSSIIGIITAIGFYRYRFHGRKVLHGTLIALIISPDIMMGISLLMLFTLIQFPLGFGSLLIAHTTFCLPFVTLTLYSKLMTLNPSLIEAAKDLGANDVTIIQKILSPLIRTAVLSGWLLAFTLSLDDVIISYFVSGPDYEILPLRIYSMIRLGVKPEIDALCTLLLLITVIAIVTAQMISTKMFRKKSTPSGHQKQK